MNASLRWVGRGLIALSLLACVPLATAQDFGAEPPQGAVLKPSGLPDGVEPEAVLPRGAVLHVRVNSAAALLNDVSSMATKFVPEKALPPDKRRLLDEPNPLLALIGTLTGGQPLSVEMLAQVSGIDMARPIALTLYPIDTPDRAFVVTLPAANLAAMSQLPPGGLRGAEEVALQGGSALRVRRGRTDMYFVCSKTQVCMTGSRDLAQMLLAAPPDGRLNKSPIVAKGLAENAEANLVIVADPEPVKPMLPMIKRMITVPEPAVANMRRQMMREISPEDLVNLNLQIRRYLNVRDLEQLLDYLECALLGTYEGVVDFAFAQADDFQGIVLALDVGADMHRLNLTVHSRAITPAGQPLPLAEAAKAVTKIPGGHNYLLLQGKAAPAGKSALLGDILGRIAARAKAKGLPEAFATAMTQAYANYQPEPTLASQVPWMITTRTAGAGAKGPADFATLQEFFTSPQVSMATVQVIPRQGEDFITNFYKQYSEASNNNDRVYRKLRADAGLGAPSYVRESRFSARQLPGEVRNLVRETSYTTQWGLFGYNEHELINREFTLCRDAGDVTLLCPGGTNPDVLTKFEPQKVPEAIKRLIKELRAPGDANRIELVRMAPMVIDFADGLAAVEQKIHDEMAEYVKKIEAAHKQGGTEEEMLARFQAIEMPVTVYQLKQNADGGFYVVTPIEMTFPRPKIMPDVLGLLEEYRQAVESQGGIASFERQAAGRYDVGIVYSTEAVATLVRTVGNKVAEKYLGNREEMQRVQGLFRTPLDGAARRHATVMTNSTWEMLSPRPGRRHQFEAPPPAQPGPPRDDF